MLKSLKFCHVINGKNSFDFHAYLSDITIEYYKNMGCIVKVLKDY